ncbi:LacI family DNA-binding transcriptional regulator [Paenibacillus sp. JMULE4]|uniref:LacI family DNA-binding transcriptional regulator n=1 Tax=Paenibacillus sp. JMULE4 TaxID=2518342 RepID=UPI001575ECA0|nr:LacI family DNA-binding transcriptional regulator [Paenibacillus sp. JMULE4]NTZ18037.1 LacI family DNA-binding transcriptional regulator [Paenibacillus sp. JMULE4]
MAIVKLVNSVKSLSKPFKQQSHRSTIGDVAREAGVSKTTISRYLSGQFDSISEQTRKRIEQTIADLKYRPNRMARGLKRDRSFSIGMIVADITNPFSTSILRGVEDVCTKHGYSLMVCNTDNDPVKEKEYIMMLQAHRIDGLIINSTGHNNEYLHELAEEQTPVVLVDRKMPELGFDTVVTNNVQATTEAMRFFLQQGYERIAFFTQPVEKVSSRNERSNTFHQFLAQANHPSITDVYVVDFRENGQLEQKLEAYLSSSQGQFRLLFAVNGVMQLKILNVLQQKGLRIPEDIAVACFDDLDWAPVIPPGITTIAQPTYEIGVNAMERVLKRIMGDQSPAETIELPGKLIIRGSTPSKTK